MLRETVKLYGIIPYKITFWLLSGLAVISSLINVVPFAVLGWMVDAIASSQEKEIDLLDGSYTDTENDVIILGAVFLSASVGAIVIRCVFAALATNFSTKVITEYRQRVFAAIALDYRNIYHELDLGEKIQRTIGDTENLDNAIGYPLTTFFCDVFDIFWITLLLLSVSVLVACTAWLALPLIVWLAWKQSEAQSLYHYTVTEAEGALINQSQRVFSNRVNILSLGGGKREVDYFKSLLAVSRNAKFKLARMMSELFAFEGTGRQLGFSIVTFAALILLSASEVTIGQVVTVLGATTRFYIPVGALARFMPYIRKAVVSINRINDILYKGRLAIEDNKDIRKSFKRLIISEPTIRLSEDRRLTLNARLILEPGQLVVLQGRSGVGKSSLLLALQGVQGTIENGVQLDDGQSPAILEQVVQYVSANSRVLTSSVEDELVYPGAMSATSKDDVSSLLRQFDLEHLLNRRNSMQSISDGERVRLLLARASLSNRPILLIDEPFINLDESSVSKVECVICNILKSGKAILLVTHTMTKTFASITDHIFHVERLKRS